MESDALGYIFMDQQKGHESLYFVLETLTLQYVNTIEEKVFRV
jgi:hypothetical protein